MEAASMQRPIIASNVPGCREVVNEGKNGYLCLKKNINSLVSCMEKMLTLSAEELTVMGSAGREHVLQLFDEKKIIAIYQQQLEEFFSTH
jgi:glycosyltransferase involved in cell wall biosynthesis